MLLDEAGVPKAAYGYTGYGEPDQARTAERVPDSGDEPDPSEQVNPFRYSAKRSDAQSGTIDMGARQFGPTLGQFLQADRYDGALADLGLSSDPLTGNRYSLAAGNPISYVEGDGHDPITTHNPAVGSQCATQAASASATATTATSLAQRRLPLEPAPPGITASPLGRQRRRRRAVGAGNEGARR